MNADDAGRWRLCPVIGWQPLRTQEEAERDTLRAYHDILEGRSEWFGTAEGFDRAFLGLPRPTHVRFEERP